MAAGPPETELYRPIYDFLTAQGYTVRSEVRNCDVTAVKDDELVIIELKRAFSTSLLIQATERQKITDSVYVALPYPASGTRNAQWKGMCHLLRRLEVGLILVWNNHQQPSVKIMFYPLPYDRKKNNKKKRAVLREIDARTGDFNEGGSCRKKVATAYRENAIHIACCLEKLGPLAPRDLRALGTGDKTLSILSSNFYDWFERVERGIYAIKPHAKAHMEHFPELTAHYRSLLEEQITG
jgi:hypothetical protein